MRVNSERESMDMEERDWNYFMPAYVNQYFYFNKNKPPKEIVFPLFESVINPQTKERIPVRYVPLISPDAIEIAQDGSNIPEATEADIAKADAEDNERKAMKSRIAELEKLVSDATTDEEPEVEPEKEELMDTDRQNEPAFTIGNIPPPPGRIPKLAPSPAEGSPDDMHSRDSAADKQIQRDLKFGEDESLP